MRFADVSGVLSWWAMSARSQPAGFYPVSVHRSVPGCAASFCDFTVQDGKLALIHLTEIQPPGIVKHEIDLTGEQGDAVIPDFGKHKNAAPKAAQENDKAVPPPY